MKRNKILKLRTAARLAHTLTIRELAKLIGNLVASMEAVPYGRLFYRHCFLGSHNGPFTHDNNINQ